MGTLRASIRASRCATQVVADSSALSGRGFCAPALLLALYTRGVRGRGQRVEKVGIELIETSNQARKVQKPACLAPDLECERGIKGVFQQPGVFSELRLEGLLGSSPTIRRGFIGLLRLPSGGGRRRGGARSAPRFPPSGS